MAEIDASTIDALKATSVRAQLLDCGKCLVVFRRQPVGSGRFAADMWKSDSAADGG